MPPATALNSDPAGAVAELVGVINEGIPAVVLLPSFLAQVCFLRGVALIGPNRAGVFINLVPIFVAILAVLFIRENFELFHAIGLFFVMGGIWLSERGKDD